MVYKVTDFIAGIGGIFSGAFAVIQAILIPLTYKLNAINAQKSIQVRKDDFQLDVEDIDYPAMTSLRFMWVDIKKAVCCWKTKESNDPVQKAKESMEMQIVEYYDMQNTYKIPNLEKYLLRNEKDIEELTRKQ